MPVRKNGQGAPVRGLPSLLTSPATRRPPPKREALRLQPRNSPVRQTRPRRERDSNPQCSYERQDKRRECQILRKGNGTEG